MRVQKTLPNGATVRELTVGEIRALLITTRTDAQEQYLKADPAQQIGMEMNRWLLPGPTLDDVQAMTDLTPARLDALTQSELTEVVDTMRELNPLFFGMKGRMDQARLAAEMAQLMGSGPSS